jgi:hypothetical protein
MNQNLYRCTHCDINWAESNCTKIGYKKNGKFYFIKEWTNGDNHFFKTCFSALEHLQLCHPKEEYVMFLESIE